LIALLEAPFDLDNRNLARARLAALRDPEVHTLGLRRLHVAQIHDFLNTGGRHKSQGSEYPAVIIPVLTQHYAMLQRNLLYTGVTRAKGWWFSSARRRPSRSRFATYRAGDAGRSSRNGFGSARPPDRRIHRRRIEFMEG
jgi:hypothetical protein